MPGPKKRHHLEDPPVSSRNFTYTPDPSLYIEPSDATNVRVVGNVVRPRANVERQASASKSAKQRNAFRAEHPNVAQWNDAAATIPFVPLAIMTGGAAAEIPGAIAAANTIGNYVRGAGKLYPWLAKALPYAETALAADMAGNAISDISNGEFTPETAINLTGLTPVASGAYKYGQNFTLPRIREHLYVNRMPIGYDNAWGTLKDVAKDVIKGERANIEMPKWMRSQKDIDAMAEVLSSYSPYRGIDEARALKDGHEYVKARVDAWRLYNKLPQKYGTFVKHPHDPSSYTAPDAVQRLNRIPLQFQGVPQHDFVTSVGGNIGVPSIIDLGTSSTIGEPTRQFGATITSDWFDLHPFSRGENQLFGDMFYDKISRPLARKLKRLGEPLAYDDKAIYKFLSQPKNSIYDNWYDPKNFPRKGIKGKIGNKLIEMSNKLKGEDFTRPRNFLDKVDDKLRKIEVGSLVGAKPFHVQYNIPWTRVYSPGFETLPSDMNPYEYIDGTFAKDYMGLRSMNNLPEKAHRWWQNNRDIYKKSLGGNVRFRLKNGGKVLNGNPPLVENVMKSLAKSYGEKKAESLKKAATAQGLTLDDVRQRLYDNLFPYGYNEDPIDNLDMVEKAVLKNEGSIYQYTPERDDVWAEYLSIPENKRHSDNEMGGSNKKVKVIDSQYSPTIGRERKKYKTLLYPEEYDYLIDDGDLEHPENKTRYYKQFDVSDSVIELSNNLDFGKNKTTKKGILAGTLGTYTVGKGVDENRGEYRSWYDLWDLAPNQKYGEDESAGIGTPVPFYDRIYLDDYYGAPTEKTLPKYGDYYGGYIPEIIINSRNKKSLGGTTRFRLRNGGKIPPTTKKK